MKRNFFLYLIIGFTTTLIIMVVISLITFQRMNTMIRYSRQVEHTHQVMGKLKSLSDLMSEAESSVRGFVITQDSSYLQPLDLVKKEYPPLMDEIQRMVSDNKLQTNRLAMIRSTLLLRLNILEGLPTAIKNKSGREVILQRVAKGRDLMNSFKESLAVMEAEEQRLLNQRFQQKEKFEKLTPQMFRIVTGVVGIIFLISFILLVKAILDRFKFQQELQEQLLSLKQSNDELTQLAFAASHDLQEPVRKIRTFTDRLRIRHKDRLDEEGTMILSRIDAAGIRLQGMLEDISTFMNLLEWKERKTLVSMRKLWEEVLLEMDAQVKSLNATVAIGPLPDLHIFHGQVHVMCRALLDNALKYHKEDLPPVISISYKEVQIQDIDVKGLPSLQKHYYAITIEDNGIGFDNEFKDKVFQLFRRLHAQEDRSGKGIGLAICQRVMANHNGVIDAFALVNKGAAFTMYFPRD